MILIVIAGDEGVLVATLRMYVVFGDQKRRLHETARLLVVECPVELVDGLIGLKLDRFRNRNHLVLAAFADAVISGTISIGGYQFDLIGIDAAAAQNRN